MKKAYLIILIALIAIVVGISFKFGDFYFTTKYYEKPLDAFLNDDSPTNEDFDEIDAELGTYKFDEENSLFLAHTNDNQLLVAEMKTKDGKYSFVGTTYLYNLEDKLDYKDFNEIKIANDKKVKWSVLLNEKKFDLLNTNYMSKEFKYKDKTIILIVYK